MNKTPSQKHITTDEIDNLKNQIGMLKASVMFLIEAVDNLANSVDDPPPERFVKDLFVAKDLLKEVSDKLE